MEKKKKKIYLTYYNSFIAQGLWQTNYQILSIIFLKVFTKLNVNIERMIKMWVFAELNLYSNVFIFIDIANVFLNTRILKMIQYNANVYFATGIAK